MYNIKFTCTALTGDKIHSIKVDDSSLEDTWLGVDMGPVKGMETIHAEVGNTHDANVFIGENEYEEEVLKLCLYDYFMEDGEVQTNHDDWTDCEIIEVKREDGKEEYIKDGEEFRYNENWDKIQCPVCERECYAHDLNTTDDLEEPEGCTDCHDEQIMYNVYYNDSGESRSGLMEIMALTHDHVRDRFERVCPGAIIDEIEEA